MLTEMIYRATVDGRPASIQLVSSPYDAKTGHALVMVGDRGELQERYPYNGAVPVEDAVRRAFAHLLLQMESAAQFHGLADQMRAMLGAAVLGEPTP